MNSRRLLTLSYLRNGHSFITSLVLRDLKLRYAHSFLGMTWLVIEPLFFALSLSAMFSLVKSFKSVTPDYPFPLFFYSGIIAWRIFSKALTDGTATFRAERVLIKKYRFPREILVGKNLIMYWVEFGFALLSLLALMIIYKHGPNLTFLLILPWVILSTAICSGLMLLFASLNVYASDVGTFFTAISSVLFWVTPIIFRIDMHSQSYWLLWLNPFAAPIEFFRFIILDRMIPPTDIFCATLVWSILLNLIGYPMFKKLEGGFVDAT